MKRALLVLAGCLALLLLGMGALSWKAADLERDARAARRQAAVEEDVRLALWRMDSAVAPILARESLGADEKTDFVRRRLRAMPGEAVEGVPWTVDGLIAACAAPPEGEKAEAADGKPQEQGRVEYLFRSKSINQAANVALPDVEARAAVRRETLRPVWVGGELVLSRPEGSEVYAVWLDWPALRTFLLAEVADLFPHAALEPAAAGVGGERLLASLPVRLVPGPAARPFTEAAGALGWILGGAWARCCWRRRCWACCSSGRWR
jgi:hypothetical protein